MPASIPLRACATELAACMPVLSYSIAHDVPLAERLVLPRIHQLVLRMDGPGQKARLEGNAATPASGDANVAQRRRRRLLNEDDYGHLSF